MSTVPSRKTESSPDWSRLVGDSLKQNGVWHTWAKLVEARSTYPDDLPLRGYCEIVRNTIVRDFLAHPKGMQAIPKLNAEFLRPIHPARQPRKAPERARHHGTSMTSFALSLLDRLPTPIAVITDAGA